MIAVSTAPIYCTVQSSSLKRLVLPYSSTAPEYMAGCDEKIAGFLPFLHSVDKDLYLQ